MDLKLKQMTEEESYILNELYSELAENLLSDDSQIQLLLDREGHILDWYYDHKRMTMLCSYDLLDSKDEDKEKLKIFDQYIKDKEDLVPMRVDDTIMFLTLDVGDVPTIKSVRLALGLSEEAAAEYLMIPVCTFKDWEKGISIDDSSTKVAIRTLAKYHRYKK